LKVIGDGELKGRTLSPIVAVTQIPLLQMQIAFAIGLLGFTLVGEESLLK